MKSLMLAATLLVLAALVLWKGWLPFNQKNRKTQAGVLLVLILLVLGFATQSRAGDFLQFGGGMTVVRGKAPALDVSLVYPEAGPKDAVVEIGATFIGASTHDQKGQGNNFAFRAALVEGFGRFDVGLGAAYLQNADAYNGSNLNFQLLLGYRFKALPISLRISHFSNGGTRSPNLGRDMLLVLWRFE